MASEVQALTDEMLRARHPVASGCVHRVLVGQWLDRADCRQTSLWLRARRPRFPAALRWSRRWTARRQAATQRPGRTVRQGHFRIYPTLAHEALEEAKQGRGHRSRRDCWRAAKRCISGATRRSTGLAVPPASRPSLHRLGVAHRGSSFSLQALRSCVTISTYGQPIDAGPQSPNAPSGAQHNRRR